MEKTTGIIAIATVIVTYNRKKLLLDCLEAIKNQSFKPTTVYIVDNASTDGTEDCLIQNGYIDDNGPTVVVGIGFEYIKLRQNTGGAGGFYTGMKTANESGRFDGVWVMDDDGVPDKDCLKYLVEDLKHRDYVAPMVIAAEDKDFIAFPYYGTRYSIQKFKELSENNFVKDFACPMNGVLFSKSLLDKVGYPIPNLFIWGDEQNLNMRCIEAGFRPVTDIRAIHYHPQDKYVTAKSLLGKEIVFVPQMWKGYCAYRNHIFNNHSNMSGYKLLKYYILHMYYFMVIKRSWKWMKCFTEAFFSGFKENPDDGFRKYMN